MTGNRNFDLLERRLLSERDSEREEEFLREIDEAELQYAIIYGTYREFVIDSRTEGNSARCSSQAVPVCARHGDTLTEAVGVAPSASRKCLPNGS